MFEQILHEYQHLHIENTFNGEIIIDLIFDDQQQLF
jgi:hypothetical protein